MLNRTKVREAIEREGRTHEWVAGRCRIARQTLNAYLSGKGEPSRAVVALLSQALNIPEAELWDEPKDKAG